MKTFFCLALVALASISLASAQVNFEKSIPLKNAQNIDLQIEYGDLKIRTWDKDELLIKGTVDINNNKNNDAYSVDPDYKGDKLVVSFDIPNIDDLPHVYWRNVDGNKVFFDSKETAESQKSYSNGIFTDIKLEVFVPKKALTEIHSTYGDVNIEDLPLPLEVHNTYGSVEAKFEKINASDKITLISTYSFIDISLPSSSGTQVKLETSYGEIFTDLELDIKDFDEGRFGTGSIRANVNGGGGLLTAKATYNNIYLRTK